MKPILALVLVIAAVVIGGGIVLGYFGVDPDSSVIQESPATEKLDAILARLDDIEERQSEAAREVGALRNARPVAAEIDERALEAAVERALAARGEAGGMKPIDASDGSEEETVAALVEEASKLPLARRLAMLDDPNLDGEKRWELLTALAKEGLIDETIEALKKRADKNAGNPDAQVDLGEAYVAKLIGGKVTFMEQGMLSQKAHQAYDRALELEPDHWRARLDKGASYYWAPAQLGMQKDALRELEHAARIQQKMKPQSGFSDTHLMIGNLHQQMGDHEKARAAWQQGLDRFPNDTQLQNKLKD